MLLFFFFLQAEWRTGRFPWLPAVQSASSGKKTPQKTATSPLFLWFHFIGAKTVVSTADTSNTETIRMKNNNRKRKNDHDFGVNCPFNCNHMQK